jgi:SAM-dependent methyltransferase
VKNMYKVLRPSWAALDRWETVVIFTVSIVVGLYGGFGDSQLKQWVPERLHAYWPVFDVVVLTFGCLFLMWCYKKFRIGCYPCTFIYCFNMPTSSNPTGKTQVVGFCYTKPVMESGEIIVKGASYFWDQGRLDIDSRVGFTSTEVYATREEDGGATTHLRFNINEGDAKKRLYRHGLLQFRLTTVTCRPVAKTSDVYASYLLSMNPESEIQNVEVQSRGCTQWYCEGIVSEERICEELRASGHLLFSCLESMLEKQPWPELWREQAKVIAKSNVWKLSIPSPQDIIRNQKVSPYIRKMLNEVLTLVGLDRAKIDTFWIRAVSLARIQDDSIIAYENELKKTIVDLTPGILKNSELNKALIARARTIYGQIQPYLRGDSLLDVGCGNGLIANLASSEEFNEIKLLDVVNYLSPAVGLPFEVYSEGKPLPVAGRKYDTVLLITVLHHASAPLELLKLAWQATRQRLIIIESVVGVHKQQIGAKYELVTLEDEDQIAFAAFVDWFYNRVLHDDVPVPCNFTTPEAWQSVFLQEHMNLINTTYLGQDIDIGPEYHVLFVLEKELAAEVTG